MKLAALHSHVLAVSLLQATRHDVIDSWTGVLKGSWGGGVLSTAKDYIGSVGVRDREEKRGGSGKLEPRRWSYPLIPQEYGK